MICNLRYEREMISAIFNIPLQLYQQITHAKDNITPLKNKLHGDSYWIYTHACVHYWPTGLLHI